MSATSAFRVGDHVQFASHVSHSHIAPLHVDDTLKVVDRSVKTRARDPRQNRYEVENGQGERAWVYEDDIERSGSSGSGRRTATKRKHSYTSRSKSGRAKKRRTLSRLRHAGATKRRGHGVMRPGHQSMSSRVLQQNSYAVGPYTEYSPAHQKALRIESAGGRGIRIDKRRGGWYVSYVSSKLLH